MHERDMISKITESTDLLCKWAAIDYILFGSVNQHVVEMKLGTNKYNDYISDKAACLSNIYDLYKSIGFRKKIKIGSEQTLIEFSIVLSEKAISESKKVISKLLHNKKMKFKISNEILNEQKFSDTDFESATLNVLDKYVKSYSIDILLLEMPIYNLNLSKEKLKRKYYDSVLLKSYELMREKLLEYS